MVFQGMSEYEEIPNKEAQVKYICFGYLDVKNWETKSESERNAMIDDCFADDDVLKKKGYWA